ncbi:MAG: hypothetical protein ACXV8L_15420, partial [Ilumatobacteraceae bacterium]
MSIDKRPNGGYRDRWRELRGGRQQTRQFARKVDAVRFLDGIQGDIAHGLYVDPNGGRTPFQEYAERWRVGQLHSPSTATQSRDVPSGARLPHPWAPAARRNSAQRDPGVGQGTDRGPLPR